jgi:hypothetical protein
MPGHLSNLKLHPFFGWMLLDCTELYLGGKSIEQLGGFERLTNLEVLWVNDNKLTAITGLDSNVRIKQLYAHVSGCSLHQWYACQADGCSCCVSHR